MKDFTNDLHPGRGELFTPRREVTLLSPYHGGSHRAWAEGLIASSEHKFDLLALPDRFWKWRMHGGAITLAKEYQKKTSTPECLLATDMLDLTTFLALTRNKTDTIPAILYMHENQLTYPLPDDIEQGPMRRQRGERDLHYSFINLASMLAADIILFNSHFHRNALFSALPNYLKHFPDYNELSAVESLEEKGRIVPVGVDLHRLRGTPVREVHPEPPLILWNHRWEYDKDPGRFFDAIYRVQGDGLPFRLALCGKNFRNHPSEFDEAKDKLSTHIVHFGYADDAIYRQLLWEASIVISTARHEFFGVSTVEAIFCHSFPILPNALSYPEIIPSEFHSECLYNNDEQLHSFLTEAIMDSERTNAIAAALEKKVSKYDWSQVSSLYDDTISQICESANHPL